VVSVDITVPSGVEKNQKNSLQSHQRRFVSGSALRHTSLWSLFPIAQSIPRINLRCCRTTFCQNWKEEERFLQLYIFMQDGAPPHYPKVVREFWKLHSEKKMWFREDAREVGHLALPSVDFCFGGTLKTSVSLSTTKNPSKNFKVALKRSALEELNKAVSVSSFSKRVDLMLSAGWVSG